MFARGHTNVFTSKTRTRASTGTPLPREREREREREFVVVGALRSRAGETLAANGPMLWRARSLASGAAPRVLITDREQLGRKSAATPDQRAGAEQLDSLSADRSGARANPVKPALAPEGVLPLLFDGWRALALEKKETGQAKGEA